MFLEKYLNRKAFTALLVGSILAIMIGSVLLVRLFRSILLDADFRTLLSMQSSARPALSATSH